MLFNTAQYFIFFIFVLTLAWLTVGLRQVRSWIILGASFYFYYANNGWQTALILVTTTVDYLVCLAMARAARPIARRSLLVVSLVSNLGMLAYFKYFNFFAQSLDAALRDTLGVRLDWVDLNIALPVGISFYTFEALSYMIDVYRGKIVAERRWDRLAFLVSFFPHLTAGPIVRAADFFPQLARRARLSPAEFELALYWIFAGLVKKIVLADWLDRYATPAFAQPGSVGTAQMWLGVFSFSLQIYFDFSGYTDIALGSAKLLGFDLPPNFHRPYAATSITEFWRRWHISLSSWLRDYVYISLGGNRMRSEFGVHRNLIATMLLGGLWHGAAWHFVIWGGLHGGLLSLERAAGLRPPQGPVRRSGWRWLGRTLAVFLLVSMLWIPFRASGMEKLIAVLGRMLSFRAGPAPTFGELTAAAVIVMAFAWQLVNEVFDMRSAFLRLPLPVKAISYSMALLAVLLFNAETLQPFIYFRF